MPRMPLHIASGTGITSKYISKTIRFVKYGCTNRPFYHIVVINKKLEQRKSPIEQVGTFDDCRNIYNEKLISFNYERIQYWIGHGAMLSRTFLEILGIAGMLPIHPRTYIKAWRKRKFEEQIK